MFKDVIRRPVQDGPLGDNASDESLLTHYQAHADLVAFQRLYERYRKDLYRYLLRVGDRADTEELYQNVWEKVIGMKRLPAQQRFAPWLFTVARNQLIDAWRKHERRGDVTTANAEETLQDVRDPQSVGEQSQTRAQLEQALAAINTDQREAFLLQQSGFSLEDIARITDSGKETVKSRLRYARSELRERLAGLMTDEPESLQR